MTSGYAQAIGKYGGRIKGVKYLSLFSGIGGFELGLEQAYENNKTRVSQRRPSKLDDIQHERNSSDINDCDAIWSESESKSIHTQGLDCVGYSEIDKYAVQIYQKHFPEHKNYGDIRTIEAELPSGWNTNIVPDFDLLVGGFPCQAFSIAGKRGGFDDTRGTLFFEIARILKVKQPRLFLLENVKGLLSHDEGRTFRTIVSTLDELGYDLQWQVLNSKDFGVPQNRERVFIVGNLRGTPRPKVFPLGTPNEKNVSTGTLAHTLNASDWRGPNRNQKQTTIRTDKQDSPEGRDKPDDSNNIRRASYSDDMRIRRLTPTECERLQGFPDGWTEGVSDTQRYKCLGNAVTVNVIKAIAERMLQ